MKRLLVLLMVPIVASCFLLGVPKAHAANMLEDLSSKTPENLFKYYAGAADSNTDCATPLPNDPQAANHGLWDVQTTTAGMSLTGVFDMCGNPIKSGLLPETGNFVAYLFTNQPSSREYVADIMGNMGLSVTQPAYAQGTGYNALSPFLEFWKVFRNIAYSLYIIMFVVVGIMIMLRTKVNAQTIITIQSAIPNLIITLILITFSYAIVGFMIDIMYFLIYFLVYLMGPAGANIISDPSKLITRFMSYSAWSVIFAGRNSIISAVAAALRGVLSGLGTGALGAAGNVLSFISIFGIGYLIVAIAFAIAMLKLMFALVKAYVMLIVQTVTAPLQILMNAVPGSQAFSGWLKRTASYLIPFPVAAAMFLFAAILVGNPADKTILGSLGNQQAIQDGNPFGVNQGAPLYQNRQNIWLPPFTLTDASVQNEDVLSLIGFFVFLMTPSAVKMAQDWLQVKESPYSAEAFQGFTGVAGAVINYPVGQIKQAQQMHEQRKLQDYAAGRYAEKMGEYRQGSAAKQQAEKPTPV